MLQKSGNNNTANQDIYMYNKVRLYSQKYSSASQHFLNTP